MKTQTLKIIIIILAIVFVALLIVCVVAQPWRYYDNNLNATLVLTKVMAEVGVKNIIFSSSATVYTASTEMPLRETSRTGDCTNPYGWTKYMTGQILSGMAFVPNDMLETFKSGMDAVLGEGACHVLSIRSYGGVELKVK